MEKTGIESSRNLRSEVLKKCKKINMKEMAADVKPFLFNPSDEKKILLFPEYMVLAKLDW